jgi:hypothetical protein
VFCTASNGEFKYITRSLQAYLCAGVFDWASEVFDVHNSVGSVSAASGENGAVDEELGCEGYQNKSEQWHWVLDVVKISKNTVLTKENIQYFQDCVKIKKWEHEIATTFAKSQTPTGDALSSLEAAGDSSNAESLLQKLEELKQHKEAFERHYISTPNPFIIYCKIKTVLYHIKEKDRQNCGDLYEQLEVLWKSITSHV